jgi:hypothetical protein
LQSSATHHLAWYCYKPGAKVFIVAVKQADGTLQGRAWRIGRDGLTPPI